MTIKINLISSLAIFSLLAFNLEAIKAQDLTQVEDVASHLVGAMDTSKQAEVNLNRVNVRMTTCQVYLDDPKSSLNIPNSIFLYQEQALGEKLNQPYRQRILRIGPNPYRGGVEAKSFKYLNSELLISLCEQQETARVITAQGLTDVNCSVFLVSIGDIYLGKTPPEGCPTSFGGATKITNLVILNSQGMETWDKGLNDQGERVWGAEDEPFIYTWLNKEQREVSP